MPTVPLKGAHRFTTDHPQQALDPLVAEVFDLGGVGIQRFLHVVPAHRRPDAHAGVEPPAREQVDRRQILSQPQRILPAQRDHRRAEGDPAGALRSGSQDRDR